MHILLLNCSLLIVSLFSYFPPLYPSSFSCHLLWCPLIMSSAYASFPAYATFISLFALPSAAHDHFLCHLLTWPFFISCACFAYELPLLWLVLFLLSLLLCAHPLSSFLPSVPWTSSPLSLSMLPYPLSVQCPWGPSPHPCSRCSMPPAGQAWVPWASPSSCWPTTLRWRSQRWTSITMRWTLNPTSAHGESTGNRTCEDYGYAFTWPQCFLHYLSVMCHVNLNDQYLPAVKCHKQLLSCGSKACISRSQRAAEMQSGTVWNWIMKQSLVIIVLSVFQEAAATTQQYNWDLNVMLFNNYLCIVTGWLPCFCDGKIIKTNLLQRKQSY